ncbi:PREDICTED: protein LYK5 [Tarenaya hassleriana]|uniref:protein LYK5 n=1 Tax=Tarenaya hassleriana TaxID=28532 RepID=UPI00053C99E5|nr:PREDICTED: protein LYK5 [Tarenaya hassleriana]
MTRSVDFQTISKSSSSLSCRLLRSKLSIFRHKSQSLCSLSNNTTRTHMAAALPFHAPPSFAVFLGLAAVLLLPPPATTQQPYVDNRQLDCYNQVYDNITEGYTCNGPRSCRAYVTFRSQPPYDTAVTIASLLNSSAAGIVSANGLPSSSAVIPRRTLVVVPIECSCSAGGRFYQHNATYRLHGAGEENGDGRLETYFFVANNTYQALSTCQALMSQNRYDSKALRIGLDLLVPVRCACPTEKQSSGGSRYLLTYLIAQGDSVSAVAEMFGSSEAAVLEANEINSSSLIYFFTPLLVPLRTEFSGIRLPPPPPPVTALPPSPPVSPPVESSGSFRKWVFVGIGIGAGLILIISISVIVLCCFRKRRTRQQEKATMSGSLTKYSVPKTQESRSWSVDLSPQENSGLKSTIESLTVYRFHDLQVATENFSEVNKIKGSVYRASINGDDAAIKVIKGDVSSSEINLLKKINHSNIIRLSGFCIREGNSYLVYEYAGKGSISGWIHSDKKEGTCMTWKERVQVARDIADALNYLHNYITPPHVHKNLKSSNILVDSNMRAKISNFGLARILNNDDQDDNGEINLKLTRHVVGTQGYLPPEYVENGVITPKLDVFAFGVVILELLSGKEPAKAQKKKEKEKDSDNNNNNNVGEQEEEAEMLWVTISQVLEGANVREKLTRFIDPCLGKEYPMELAYAMAQLAKSCVARDLNSRPSISDVLTTLLMIVSSSMEWEPSDEMHRSRSVGDSS